MLPKKIVILLLLLILHVLIGGSGSDSSDVTGVPKSSKLPTKHQTSDGSDYGYVTQTMEQTMERFSYKTNLCVCEIGLVQKFRFACAIQKSFIGPQNP